MGLALAERGFLFGTQFDIERNTAIRPCERFGLFRLPDNLMNKIMLHSCESHASLKQSTYLGEDFLNVKLIIDKFDTQRTLVSNWLKKGRESKSNFLKMTSISKEELNIFFDI